MPWASDHQLDLFLSSTTYDSLFIPSFVLNTSHLNFISESTLSDVKLTFAEPESRIKAMEKLKCGQD